MALHSTTEKDEADADKAAAKAADDAAKKEAKREADERAAIKAHLSDILLLRGLARAASPHGAENLAAALDGIANAIVAGRKLEDDALIEVAIALKNPAGDWAAMVKRINELSAEKIKGSAHA